MGLTVTDAVVLAHITNQQEMGGVVCCLGYPTSHITKEFVVDYMLPLYENKINLNKIVNLKMKDTVPTKVFFSMLGYGIFHAIDFNEYNGLNI